MIRHIFLWSVKDGEDGDAVLARLAELEHRVPGLRGFTIGKHEGEQPNSSAGKWQYALTTDFDSFEQLDEYQNHPEHQKIVDEVMGAYDDWAVLDYTL
ncbi:MAG TPA: Dabb family protein [Baekduia sp.]|nr:Dabb family protein [Baekduia sp.]